MFHHGRESIGAGGTVRNVEGSSNLVGDAVSDMYHPIYQHPSPVGCGNEHTLSGIQICSVIDSQRQRFNDRFHDFLAD